MFEKKVEPRQTSSRDSTTQAVSTQAVVDLLTSILNDVQNRVQSETPTPLEGKAVEAVEQFREIGAALQLQRRPTIDLIAEAKTDPTTGTVTVTLTWTSSTEAQPVSVSIDQQVEGEEVKSLGKGLAANGSMPDISVSKTTTFTATAKGLCSSTPDRETVAVGNVD